MGSLAALGSAVYRLVDGATTTPVYYALAPQGTAHPFVMVQRQDAQDQHTFTGTGLTAEYVVKAVSRDQWPTAALGIYEGVHAGIEGGGTVTVSGQRLLRFERQTVVEYRDPDGYWHVGGIYRVEIWEA